MKTTIEIRTDLLREAKEQARREKTTLRALVEAGLRQELRRRKGRRKPYRWKDASVGGEGLQPGIDLRNWEQIRAMIYEGRGG